MVQREPSMKCFFFKFFLQGDCRKRTDNDIKNENRAVIYNGYEVVEGHVYQRPKKMQDIKGRQKSKISPGNVW